MTHPDSSPTGGSDHDGVNLRLLWPQWQGAGTSSVEAFASEFPLDVARRGYAVGMAVLEAVLPPHDGPTVTAPVAMSDDGLEERDGVEAKAVILKQLARALEVVRRHDPARIVHSVPAVGERGQPVESVGRAVTPDLGPGAAVSLGLRSFRVTATDSRLGRRAGIPQGAAGLSGVGVEGDMTSRAL